MSGAYNRQWTGRQQQPPPPRKRRLVNYYMQRLSEQPKYEGQREDGHRFGVNRILPLGENGLLSAGRDGVVRLWDISAARARVGGRGRQTEEGTTTSESSRCSAVFASHTDWVTGLAVAAGRIMASCSNDGTLKIWDLAAAGASGAARDPNSVNAPMKRAQGRPGLSDDVEEELEAEEGEDEGGGRGGGGWGGGGDGAGSSLAWSAPSGDRENGGKAVKTREEGDRGVHAAGEAPARPGPLATVSGHGDYVKCLTYAPDAGVLVSGGLDKRIVLWDLQRVTAPLMVLRPGDAEDEAGSPTSSATASITASSASGTAASGARVWKNHGGALRSGSDGREAGTWLHLRDPSRVVLRSGMAAAGPNEIFELCRQKNGSVYCVDASADGALVASGGTDRMIRLLDPRAGPGRAAKICKLDGHRENVRCVRIDEGGTRVVSGSTDGTIRVWDVRQQCCLGFYDLPGGAVWAMHPSPCDFDVYYSGGRGRRVYRTDFRTGQSALVCTTESEVLDMAVELGRGSNGGAEDNSMVMWLSSTAPDIGLWGGVAGGGETLRAGGAKGPPASGSSTASGPKVVYGVEGAAPVDGTYVLRGPVEVLRGHPGVVRHVALNNRRHVLTEDNANPPNVSLWDVTKAKQVEVFPPGTIMEEKERALTEIIAVRPWFAVDTHLGTPVVTLAESTAFDGELYAVDASGERRTLLHDPFPPSPSLEEPQQRLSVALGASSRAKGGTIGVRRPGNGAARPSKARSMQDEVKVNLGEAVLRGLFSRWIEQPFRLNGSGLSQSRRGLGRNGSYSSGESGEDEDSDDQDHTSTYSSRSGTLRSRTSSEASAGDRGNGGGSGNGGDGGARSKRSGGTDHFPGREGLDLDLMNSGSGGGLGGGRGIGDDTVLWVTETDLGGNGGIQRTLLQKRVGEFDGREGEDVIPSWVVSCVIHGDFNPKDQTKVAFFLAPWVPPESTNSTGKRAGGADEAGTGTSASRGSHQASQRYTAPAQMQISKVMAYVLTHNELRQHLDSTGPKVGNGGGGGGGGGGSGEGGATSSFPPEDIVEVLCGSCVLEPHLYVGAIQQYIWNPNASGTLSLHYRSRWRSST